MKRQWTVIILIGAVICAAVYGLSGKPHEFLSGDCFMCHVDAEKDPASLKKDVTSACSGCHSKLEQTQSHPTDIYPTMPVPADMPLMEGRLTCLTCHFAHPKEKKEFVQNRFFLRRMVRGPLFCNICHDLDEKGHVVSEKLHAGSFEVTDPSSRLDTMSLECIECHDRYINEPIDLLGAGRWDHTGDRLSHPVGISYGKISMKKMRDYRNPGSLRKEVRLFDGKIGCGTCHNIYSKRRNMLVMNNAGSRLCLECHIK